MGLIHLYCGDGKGKTTAAIGLGIRACGNGMKVLFAGFLKDSSSSELVILNKIKLIDVLFCDKSYDFYYKLKGNEQLEAKQSYLSIFNYIKQNYQKYDMIIMDEIIHAVNMDIISQSDLLQFLKTAKQTTELVLTGRNPPQIFSENADYISEIFCIKHPYENGMPARKGIEY